MLINATLNWFWSSHSSPEYSPNIPLNSLSYKLNLVWLYNNKGSKMLFLYIVDKEKWNSYFGLIFGLIHYQ